MPQLEDYKGREQTYIKHFLLENYLEGVAYSICWYEPDFVYVDGFSGPWKSIDELYEDTSFSIAINKLRKVKENLIQSGKTPNIRCLFIEENPSRFKDLEKEIAKVDDLTVELKNGSFEDLIQEVYDFIGNSFSFTFIDPSGWTGFSLEKLKPILTRRGEVLINIMYLYIQRFVDDPPESLRPSFDNFFGGEGWEDERNHYIQKNLSREEATINVYLDRLKSFGKYSHTTSAQILIPDEDRTFFYLVHGTKDLTGLQKFSQVERKLFNEQFKVRNILAQNKTLEIKGQFPLFPPDTPHTGSQYLEDIRNQYLNTARQKLLELINTHKKIPYDLALSKSLEIPFVWEKDLKSWLKEWLGENQIIIEGLKEKETAPKAKQNHFITLKTDQIQ